MKTMKQIRCQSQSLRLANILVISIMQSPKRGINKYIKSYIDKQPLQSLSKMKAVVLFELIDTCRQKRVLILCVQHNGRISRNSTTVLSRYKSPEGKTITMFALMSIITTYGLKLNAHIRLNSSENNDLFFSDFIQHYKNILFLYITTFIYYFYHSIPAMAIFFKNV